MKIHYRVCKDNDNASYIEVIRVFGSDPEVVLPEKIDGLDVRKVAAYAFSEKKVQEETDVLIWQSKEGIIGVEGERLLAGTGVTEVVLPHTVTEIGNYIFYGCKELRRLEFTDALMNVGSGAFTGCGKLYELNVHLRNGKKSCVKEILGDLWQRIDVTFYCYEKGQSAEQIRLVFPEHYEEAVENTPARILFTQHHGAGNHYRQCFLDKEVDYGKYDELFPLAQTQDRTQMLVDLVFDRLMYPHGLKKRCEEQYQRYIEEHFREVADVLVRKEQLDRLRVVSGRGLWNRERLDIAIEQAAAYGKGEVLSFLMEEKHQNFPEPKKRRFEL